MNNSRCLIALLLLLATASSPNAAGPDIRGAGATFPFPIYARWAEDYRAQTGNTVSYEPLGSGAGTERVEQRRVDFGATDVPLTAADLQRFGLLQFPAVIGGVVPVVNLAGIKSGELRLDGKVLGDIYLGKLRKWNDREIAELNPGLELPGTYITVVHRADASGTSFLWSEFLSRSNPDWQARVGSASTLQWPLGVAATGNEGMAASVQRTRSSIGYVEYAYARPHRLTTLSLRNRDGVFVQPGADSFKAAAEAARWQSQDDLQQLLIDEAGTASWPITAPTFILLPSATDDPARSMAVIRFFDWALKHGQRAAQSLDYFPMPDAAVQLIDRVWGGWFEGAGEASTNP